VIGALALDVLLPEADGQVALGTMTGASMTVTAVAIVGLSGRTPGASGSDARGLR
jgi:hypothetical protein